MSAGWTAQRPTVSETESSGELLSFKVEFHIELGLLNEIVNAVLDQDIFRGDEMLKGSTQDMSCDVLRQWHIVD